MKNKQIVMTNIIPIKRIQSKIIIVRDQPVILDRDLAELYDVETRVLTQAVRRNIKRFPEDFMFQLDYKEFTNLISQFVISNSSWGGTRKMPYAFTENGVAMLSSVLNSDKAIQINIQIMRVFTSYAREISSYEELRKAIYELAIKHEKDYEHLSMILFHEVDRLEQLIIKPSKRIGFKQDV